MKSFKQFLKEDKKSLKEAKELQRSMNGSKIGFDSIGSGFEIRVDPFTGKGFSMNEHRLAFSVFSSGTVDYYKDASKEDVDLYMAVRNKEVNLADKDQPYGKVLKESSKMYDEIKKAVDDFDKRIEAITKKYGYKKV